MKRFSLLHIVFGLLVPSFVLAQVPTTVSYQGRLDSAGVPIKSPKNLTFAMYSAATGGTALWTETQSNVPFSSGVFTVQLGSVTAFPATLFTTSGPWWLGVTLAGASEMTPRFQFTSSPFALRALQADNVADNAITSAKILDGTIATADIANSAITSAKILDGTITAADMSTGLRSAYTLIQTLNTGYVDVPSTWTKLNIGTKTFTKALAETKIELLFNSQIMIGTITGTASSSIMFEVRVDDLEATIQNRGSILTSGVTQWVSMVTVFENLTVGSHVVSVWALTSGTSTTQVLIDPYGRGGTIVVRECL